LNRLLVRELLEDKGLQLLLFAEAGESLERAVTDPSVNKLGLALTGIAFALDPGQIQLLGGSEIAYLQMLSGPERMEVIAKLLAFDFPCLIATRGLTPPRELLAALADKGIAGLTSSLDTAEFIRRLSRYLDDRLAPRISFHGVLVDVIGIGVLILGSSGIGKSETALDLVLRGHRLVADDLVEISRRGNASLVGNASDMVRFHMEIRGLGIINIQDLFGVAATRDRKRIDLVVELVEWEEGKDFDRLGLDEETYPILGVEVARLTIPVRPGRNVSSIVEVAARNQLLKQRGRHSARDFQQRLLAGLVSGAEPPTSMDEVE
jgi:HPr kinase/phosphorylase